MSTANRIAAWLLALVALDFAGRAQTSPEVDAKPGFATDPARHGELAVPAKGGSASPGAPRAAAGRLLATGFPFTRVGFNRPGDGSLWACGTTYKVQFTADGTTVVPFFGSAAPRNFPITLSLSGGRVGSRSLAIGPQARVERDGDSVTLDWGEVREVYHLAVDSLEQTFELARPSAPGDVVLDLAVRTELQRGSDAAGLVFTGAHGALHYGRAHLVGGGRRPRQIGERWTPAGIELRVPADLAAAAPGPLVIDPLLRVAPLFGSTAERAPDIAYDLATNQFMVVWEHLASAADADIYGHYVHADGTPVANGRLFIDLTTDYWQLPVVANLRIPRRFLCAAMRGAYPNRQIWGRWTDAGTVNQGPQFEISAGAGSGDKRYPTIGGDPHPIGPTYWCVAWEREFSATDRDIHARLVQADGTLAGSLILVDNSSFTIDTFPDVSRCNGNPSAATQDWNIVFERQVGINDHDIRFARVHWDGAMTTPSSPLFGTPADERYPAAASVLDDDGGPRTWLAVFQTGPPQGDTDVVGVLLRGAAPIAVANLSQLEGVAAAAEQRVPSVDSDGCRFAVGYMESSPNTRFDAYVATFHVTGGAGIAVSESHVAVATTADDDTRPELCATRSGGGGNQVYGMTWWRTAQSLGAIAVGAYAGHGPGGFTYLSTTCDGFGMNAAGTPSLGSSVDVGVADPGPSQPVLLLGLPITPLPLCGSCRLAVDPGAAVPTFALRLTLTIPCRTEYLGAVVAVQGFGLGAGPCLGGTVRVADTILITIQ